MSADVRARVKLPSPPSVTPAPTGLLQRKCACGGSPGPSGECADCQKKRLGLQRKESGAAPAMAPPVVHDVLRSPGRPLEPEVRSSMEERFGHDFGRVRVHADAKAAESAQAVGALAYTVGSHVAFAAGRYSPASREGRRLLAHELVHTVQQGPASAPGEDLRISSPADAAEREAESASAQIAQGVAAGSPRETVPRQLARDPQDAGTPETSNSPAQENEPLNKAGHSLSERDRGNATREAGASAPSGPMAAAVQGARFVLHDTASTVGDARIQERRQQGRRSSGHGSGGWAPRETAEVVSHQPFFGSRRPTATQWERGDDLMTVETRSDEVRAVWRASDRTLREAALDAVLAVQGSPGPEARRERLSALAQLRSGTARVRSAGTWAVEDLCTQVAKQGVAAVAAAPGREAALEAACTRLAPLFATRTDRIGSTVNVEIVQRRGTDCRATRTAAPLPPYTDNQYQGVKRLYLRAALEAGVFPEITTHFLVDRGIGDHCDPRCFDVNRLYALIQTALGHRAGSLYGIAPSYGTAAPHNVWWYARVCGGAPPGTP